MNLTKQKEIFLIVVFALLKRISPKLRKIVTSFEILAYDMGHVLSVKEEMAIDSKGDAIPWYTYPAIEYLSSFDFSNCDVFEYGSGNSSLYWASRARSICSVEDNQEWFEIIRKKKIFNQTILYRGEQFDYVKALCDQGKLFEIIIIDGNWRMQCVAEAIKYLKTGGFIILDNSDRILEKKCGKLLREQGFLQVDFSGFGPINDYSWTTSLFLRTPTLLQHNFSGPSPIGGLTN